MIFSRHISGTKKNKTKLSWFDYYFSHCWMTGWQSIRHNFITWMDLVWFEENQKHYTLLNDDEPFEQCYLTFWYDLNDDDDTYPKEFLEYLMQMVEDIETGKEKLIPFTTDMFDDLKELVGDMVDSSESATEEP